MTPSKHGTTTSIRIEKVIKSQIDQSMVAHTAGGQHAGLVINKQSTTGKLIKAQNSTCFSLLWIVVDLLYNSAMVAFEIIQGSHASWKILGSP